MSSSDAKTVSVVDALVKATVRSVLFPGLKDTTGSPNRAAVWATKVPIVDKPTYHPQEAAKGKPVAPFVVGSHFAHVLSYASWSDAQLTEEKRRLRRCLKSQHEKLSEQALTRPEQDEDESVLPSSNSGQPEKQTEEYEAAVLEAYALVTLFQNERAIANVGDTPPSFSHKLLHAQLDLYAKYFERTQQRKIQHEVDILPIQNMYQNFVQSTMPGTFSSTTGGAIA